MDVKLHLPSKITSKAIAITGSKSETNRLLLLQALYPNISFSNESESDDSEVMRKVLSSKEKIIDVHHAGTAMRFLTAFFAIQEGSEVVLTGSERMKERPIKVLVDALKELGAEISYLGEDGFPPLKIKGKHLRGKKVTLRADVSSQYISALMLIGSRLPDGINIILDGPVTSMPYVKMTLSLLNEAGIEAVFSGNTITVPPATAIENVSLTIESDWSSASYYYSIIALAEPDTTLTLTSFRENSHQGDSELAEVYKQFGVETSFVEGSIILHREEFTLPDKVALDLNNTPDIAQTIAVTCLALGVDCMLSGLHTLTIKETDRLTALKVEIEKFDGQVNITSNSLELKCPLTLGANVEVDTYNDHRMALAFAPLAVLMPIVIKNAGVVSKSYPAFWEDMMSIGFDVSPV